MLVVLFLSDNPDKDFENTHLLVCSFSAMQQADAEARAKRPEVVSMVSAIINSKLTAEGKLQMDDTAFWECIQKANSQPQRISDANIREVHRVL